MRKVVILQARMSSKRLPGKVVAKICGQPMIGLIIERLRAAQRADTICAAIPESAANDELADLLCRLHVQVVRGDEEDVLSRFMLAAKATHADLIVRVTGDNPLISPKEIDLNLAVLEARRDLDWVRTEGYPRGIAPEYSFTLDALQRLDRLVQEPRLREHVTLAFEESYAPFSGYLIKIPAAVTTPWLRLTVDDLHDLQFIRQIYKQLYQPGRVIEFQQIMKLVERKIYDQTDSTKATANLSAAAESIR